MRATELRRLAEGQSPKVIGQALGVQYQSVYNWVNARRKHGVVGLLGGHSGGRPPILPSEMLDTAVAIAREQALSLPQIAKAVEAQHQTPLPCCLVTLASGL